MRYTQIFENFFQEISVPFVLVLKISKFLVEWKAPMFTQIQKNFALHSLSRSALIQGSPRALHLTSRQTCLSGGNPLCMLEDLFPE